MPHGSTLSSKMDNCRKVYKLKIDNIPIRDLIMVEKIPLTLDKQGKVTLPLQLVEILNWENGGKIYIETKTKGG